MSNNTSNAGTAASGGAIYGLGIFGAWVFFWQQADSFWEKSTCGPSCRGSCGRRSWCAKSSRTWPVEPHRASLARLEAIAR